MLRARIITAIHTPVICRTTSRCQLIPSSSILRHSHWRLSQVRLLTSPAPSAPLRSSLGIVATLVCTGFISVSTYLLFSTDIWEETPSQGYKSANSLLEDNVSMVDGALPGRPGNLTAEQEIKLQEFWRATLRVFGVLSAEDAAGEESTNGTIDTGAPDRTDTAASAEKKHKRMSLFSRKRKDPKHETSSVGSEHSKGSDAEDKYGQTQEFHQALESSSPAELREAFWRMVKCDNPDALLLRFLRARKWDVDKALVMMVSTMKWRSQDVHIEMDIIRRGEAGAAEDAASDDPAKKKEGEDFLAQLRLGKSYLHGTDREGRPLCTVRTHLHRQGEQSESSLERFTVHVLETARLLLVPPVDTASIVFDMTHFSMANMDYGPVKFMIRCFEANYPESLGVVLVHKAPWVFQGIWKIIRGWLDPVVAGKVHFTNSPEELDHYIARDHIVKELGGDDPYEYHYIEPREGENAAMADTTTRDRFEKERWAVIQEFETATQEWLRGPAINKPVSDQRKTLAEKLRHGYWQLDPYVRARSLLDRTGVIEAGGRIVFYPSSQAQTGQSSAETSSAPGESQSRDKSGDA